MAELKPDFVGKGANRTQYVMPAGMWIARNKRGQTYHYPAEMRDEVERVFGKDSPPAEEVSAPKAKGPLLRLENGAVIRLFEPIPKGEIFDLARARYVVRRTPDPDKAHMPPFLNKTPSYDLDEPIPGTIIVVDTDRRSLERYREHVVEWPGFDIMKGKAVVEGMLESFDIKAKFRIFEVEPAVWHVRKWGKRWFLPKDRPDNGARLYAPQGAHRQRGSKYDWGSLIAGQPRVMEGKISTLRTNFVSWANARGIRWQVKFAQSEPGFVIATRKPDKSVGHGLG